MLGIAMAHERIANGSMQKRYTSINDLAIQASDSNFYTTPKQYIFLTLFAKIEFSLLIFSNTLSFKKSMTQLLQFFCCKIVFLRNASVY